MNYELAKELKDAGFPFVERVDRAPINRGQFVVRHQNGGFDSYAAPTLEELIEACGMEFDCLRLIKPDLPKEDYWFAEADSQRMGGIGCDGSTPTEAVARLWLELNKKV